MVIYLPCLGDAILYFLGTATFFMVADSSARRTSLSETKDRNIFVEII